MKAFKWILEVLGLPAIIAVGTALGLLIAGAIFTNVNAMSNTAVAGEYVTESVRVNFVKRTYELYDGGGDTLAVVYHGGGGSGKGICGQVKLDIEAPTWVVACPNAKDKWNSGALSGLPDDIRFTEKLINKVSRNRGINRIVFIGHSQGGFMVNKLACDRPDLVDGIVVNASAMLTEDCTSPMNVLWMHSIDWTFEIPEGTVFGDKHLPYTCPGGLTECEMQNSSQPWPPAENGVNTWMANAVNGGEVVEIKFTGGCHGWPGTKPSLKDRLRNCIPPTFPGTEYLVNWMDTHVPVL